MYHVIKCYKDKKLFPSFPFVSIKLYMSANILRHCLSVSPLILTIKYSDDLESKISTLSFKWKQEKTLNVFCTSLQRESMYVCNCLCMLIRLTRQVWDKMKAFVKDKSFYLALYLYQIVMNVFLSEYLSYFCIRGLWLIQGYGLYKEHNCNRKWNLLNSYIYVRKNRYYPRNIKEKINF